MSSERPRASHYITPAWPREGVLFTVYRSGTADKDDNMANPQPSPDRLDVRVQQALLLLDLDPQLAIFPIVSNAKTPFSPNGFKNGDRDRARIERFLRNPGALNYGITILAPSDLFALDIDGGNGVGESWHDIFTSLVAELGPFAATWAQKTPSGGWHFIARMAPGFPIPAGNKMWGWTARTADTGYIVGPGSVIDGVMYTRFGPDTIATISEPWAKSAQNASKDALIVLRDTDDHHEGYQLPSSVGEGDRYNAVRDFVASRYNRGVTPEEIWAAVKDVLAPRFTVPLPERDLLERFERTMKGISERLGPPAYAGGPGSPTQPRPDTDDPTLPGLDPLASGAFPPPCDPSAFDGLAGDTVLALTEYTTAAPVGLLASILSISGVILSTTGRFYGRQTSSFMTSLVGETGSRKGTAMNMAWDVLTAPNAFGPQWGVVVKGAGSGEGVIYHANKESENKGFARLLVKEGELASVLTVKKRDGSTLSTVLRDAFDNEPLANMRQGHSIFVPPANYQLGLLAGITPSELRLLLVGGSDVTNGWANRILWVPVEGRDGTADDREILLPDVFMSPYARALEDSSKSSVQSPYGLTDDAKALLDAYHAHLLTLVGVQGALARRFSTIAYRIALVHASLDRDSHVRETYVSRAIALTEYCRSGVGWVFGGNVSGNRDAQHVLRALSTAGHPLGRKALGRAIWGGRYRPEVLTNAIDDLVENGMVAVTRVQNPAGGPAMQVVALVEEAQMRWFGGVGTTAARARARGEKKEDANRAEGGPDYVNERNSSSPNPIPNPISNSSLIGSPLSPDSEEVEEPARAPVDPQPETRWRVACRFFSDHQSAHRQISPGLWTCETCEEMSKDMSGPLPDMQEVL